MSRRPGADRARPPHHRRPGETGGPRECRWRGSSFGAVADSFDRYARLAPDGDVVTVAEFEVQRLTELLKAVVESGRLRRPPEDKAQPLRLWRTRKLRLKA
jgi:hypothetical protein